MSEKLSNQENIFSKSLLEGFNSVIGTMSTVEYFEREDGNVEIKRAGMVSTAVGGVGKFFGNIASLFKGKKDIKDIGKEAVQGSKEMLRFKVDAGVRFVGNKIGMGTSTEDNFFEKGSSNFESVIPGFTRFVENNLKNKSIEQIVDELATKTNWEKVGQFGNDQGAGVLVFLQQLMQSGATKGNGEKRNITTDDVKNAILNKNSILRKTLVQAIFKTVQDAQMQTEIFSQKENATATEITTLDKNEKPVIINAVKLRGISWLTAFAGRRVFLNPFVQGVATGPIGPAYGVLSTAMSGLRQTKEGQVSISQTINTLALSGFSNAKILEILNEYARNTETDIGEGEKQKMPNWAKKVFNVVAQATGMHGDYSNKLIINGEADISVALNQLMQLLQSNDAKQKTEAEAQMASIINEMRAEQAQTLQGEKAQAEAIESYFGRKAESPSEMLNKIKLWVKQNIPPFSKGANWLAETNWYKQATKSEFSNNKYKEIAQALSDRIINEDQAKIMYQELRNEDVGGKFGLGFLNIKDRPDLALKLLITLASTFAQQAVMGIAFNGIRESATIIDSSNSNVYSQSLVQVNQIKSQQISRLGNQMQQTASEIGTQLGQIPTGLNGQTLAGDLSKNGDFANATGFENPNVGNINVGNINVGGQAVKYEIKSGELVIHNLKGASLDKAVETILKSPSYVDTAIPDKNGKPIVPRLIISYKGNRILVNGGDNLPVTMSFLKDALLSAESKIAKINNSLTPIIYDKQNLEKFATIEMKNYQSQVNYLQSIFAPIEEKIKNLETKNPERSQEIMMKIRPFLDAKNTTMQPEELDFIIPKIREIAKEYGIEIPKSILADDKPVVELSKPLPQPSEKQKFFGLELQDLVIKGRGKLEELKRSTGQFLSDNILGKPANAAEIPNSTVFKNAAEIDNLVKSLNLPQGSEQLKATLIKLDNQMDNAKTPAEVTKALQDFETQKNTLNALLDQNKLFLQNYNEIKTKINEIDTKFQNVAQIKNKIIQQSVANQKKTQEVKPNPKPENTAANINLPYVGVPANVIIFENGKYFKIVNGNRISVENIPKDNYGKARVAIKSQNGGIIYRTLVEKDGKSVWETESQTNLPNKPANTNTQVKPATQKPQTEQTQNTQTQPKNDQTVNLDPQSSILSNKIVISAQVQSVLGANFKDLNAKIQEYNAAIESKNSAQIQTARANLERQLELSSKFVNKNSNQFAQTKTQFDQVVAQVRRDLGVKSTTETVKTTPEIKPQVRSSAEIFALLGNEQNQKAILGGIKPETNNKLSLALSDLDIARKAGNRNEILQKYDEISTILRQAQISDSDPSKKAEFDKAKNEVLAKIKIGTDEIRKLTDFRLRMEAEDPTQITRIIASLPNSSTINLENFQKDIDKLNSVSDLQNRLNGFKNQLEDAKSKIDLRFKDGSIITQEQAESAKKELENRYQKAQKIVEARKADITKTGESNKSLLNAQNSLASFKINDGIETLKEIGDTAKMKAAIDNYNNLLAKNLNPADILKAKTEIETQATVMITLLEGLEGNAAITKEDFDAKTTLIGNIVRTAQAGAEFANQSSGESKIAEKPSQEIVDKEVKDVTINLETNNTIKLPLRISITQEFNLQKGGQVPENILANAKPIGKISDKIELMQFTLNPSKPEEIGIFVKAVEGNYFLANTDNFKLTVALKSGQMVDLDTKKMINGGILNVDKNAYENIQRLHPESPEAASYISPEELEKSKQYYLQNLDELSKAMDELQILSDRNYDSVGRSYGPDSLKSLYLGAGLGGMSAFLNDFLLKEKSPVNRLKWLGVINAARDVATNTSNLNRSTPWGVDFYNRYMRIGGVLNTLVDMRSKSLNIFEASTPLDRFNRAKEVGTILDQTSVVESVAEQITSQEVWGKVRNSSTYGFNFEANKTLAKVVEEFNTESRVKNNGENLVIDPKNSKKANLYNKEGQIIGTLEKTYDNKFSFNPIGLALNFIPQLGALNQAIGVFNTLSGLVGGPKINIPSVLTTTETETIKAGRTVDLETARKAVIEVGNTIENDKSFSLIPKPAGEVLKGIAQYNTLAGLTGLATIPMPPIFLNFSQSTKETTGSQITMGQFQNSSELFGKIMENPSEITNLEKYVKSGGDLRGAIHSLKLVDKNGNPISEKEVQIIEGYLELRYKLLNNLRSNDPNNKAIKLESYVGDNKLNDLNGAATVDLKTAGNNLITEWNARISQMNVELSKFATHTDYTLSRLPVEANVIASSYIDPQTGKEVKVTIYEKLAGQISSENSRSVETKIGGKTLKIERVPMSQTPGVIINKENGTAVNVVQIFGDDKTGKPEFALMKEPPVSKLVYQVSLDGKVVGFTGPWCHGHNWIEAEPTVNLKVSRDYCATAEVCVTPENTIETPKTSLAVATFQTGTEVAELRAGMTKAMEANIEPIRILQNAMTEAEGKDQNGNFIYGQASLEKLKTLLTKTPDESMKTMIKSIITEIETNKGNSKILNEWNKFILAKEWQTLSAEYKSVFDLKNINFGIKEMSKEVQKTINTSLPGGNKEYGVSRIENINGEDYLVQEWTQLLPGNIRENHVTATKTSTIRANLSIATAENLKVRISTKSTALGLDPNQLCKYIEAEWTTISDYTKRKTTALDISATVKLQDKETRSTKEIIQDKINGVDRTKIPKPVPEPKPRPEPEPKPVLENPGPSVQPPIPGQNPADPLPGNPLDKPPEAIIPPKPGEPGAPKDEDKPETPPVLPKEPLPPKVLEPLPGEPKKTPEPVAPKPNPLPQEPAAPPVTGQKPPEVVPAPRETPPVVNTNPLPLPPATPPVSPRPIPDIRPTAPEPVQNAPKPIAPLPVVPATPAVVPPPIPNLTPNLQTNPAIPIITPIPANTPPPAPVVPPAAAPPAPSQGGQDKATSTTTTSGNALPTTPDATVTPQTAPSFGGPTIEGANAATQATPQKP